MRQWSLVAIFALLLASCTSAPPRKLAAESTVLVESFPSTMLGRPYEYAIYLPSTYAQAPQERFPVVYLLHGANGFATEWLQPDRGNVKPTLDKLIAECKIPPMVVVMPGHTGGWWVDGTKEKAEAPFFGELKPLVESKYRVRTDRGGVQIAGDSAGGYAALRWALKYPQLFGAAAPLSPAVYVDAPPTDSSARRQGQFAGPDGQFSVDVWRSLNYPLLLDAYKAQPLRVPMYVNTGDDDKFQILPEAYVLYQTMREIQKGKVELRVVDGDHDWSVWSSTIDDALEYMAPYITQPPVVERPCDRGHNRPELQAGNR